MHGLLMTHQSVWIELSNRSEEEVWVNANRITSITREFDKTRLVLEGVQNSFIFVTEPPAEVVRRIMESHTQE